MLTQEFIMDILNNNCDTIKSYGIEKIGLFGSYIRNSQNDLSDVDILVEFSEGKKSFRNYMGLKLYLEELFKTKVDLVIEENIKPELVDEIKGSVLYA